MCRKKLVEEEKTMYYNIYVLFKQIRTQLPYNYLSKFTALTSNVDVDPDPLSAPREKKIYRPDRI